MSCCGNNRAAAAHHTQPNGVGQTGTAGSQAERRPRIESVYFQYTGATALSVQGMFSRQNYRFSSPLAVLAVDGRDAPSMAAVPMLRRVHAPE